MTIGKMTDWFEYFKEITIEQDKVKFKDDMEKTGFPAFNHLINAFFNKLKEMDESEFKQVEDWIQLGNELFPHMASISPAWDKIWEQLHNIYLTKVNLYNKVPEAERSGEWQVLYDNPLSTDEIVCNTSKTFIEATYIVAKYNSHLKKTEYVNLQKVVTVVKIEGK